MAIYIYECSMCRYVWLNALNILQVPRPCFIATRIVPICQQFQKSCFELVMFCCTQLCLYYARFVPYLTLVQNVTLFPILIWQTWTKCRTKVLIYGNLVLTKVTPKVTGPL